MRAALTTEFLRRLPAGPVDIWDTKTPRFLIRVRANGNASYLVCLKRGVWHTVAKVGAIDLAKARALAQGVIGEMAVTKAEGRDPIVERRARKAAARQSVLTFDDFLREHFTPWATEHHKRGAETAQRLRSVFADFLGLTLAELTPWAFAKWRTERLKQTDRPRPATVNSHLSMLKAVLAKAVEWRPATGLTVNPLADVEPLAADRFGRMRYLSPEEEKRLRAAMAARDAARSARRDASNAWRRERDYREYPAERNHLTTVVILALNTGLRKGELLGLRWTDVDLNAARITVRGEAAKTGQTRHVPLNSEALTMLRAWKATAPAGEPDVFPGRSDGDGLRDIKKAWAPVVKAAKLTDFTFHDLRHTFASKLVMAGEPLNTVRELLGHATLTMTIRYAHLAPAHRAAAVEKLVARA